MATIRKRGAKWQAQVRRSGLRGISRSFRLRKDAVAWARHMELEADRSGLPVDTKILKRITLFELVKRYRDTISVRKRGGDIERIVLTAFLRHPICRKCLSQITTEDFAAYKDERLRAIKATTLKRELSPPQNMFEIARTEWNLPIHENPLSKLRLAIPAQRRERRLRDGELESLTSSAQHLRNKLILPIILLAIETGMRRSEILRLVWSDVEAERNLVQLLRTKNGYSRTIPVEHASHCTAANRAENR